MENDNSKIITGVIIGMVLGVGASYLAYMAKRGHWWERMHDAASCMKENMNNMVAKCHKNTKECDHSEKREENPQQ